MDAHHLIRVNNPLSGTRRLSAALLLIASNRHMVRPRVTVTPPPTEGIIVERDVEVAVRDGTMLRVDVYRPELGAIATRWEHCRSSLGGSPPTGRWRMSAARGLLIFILVFIVLPWGLILAVRLVGRRRGYDSL